MAPNKKLNKKKAKPKVQESPSTSQVASKEQEGKALAVLPPLEGAEEEKDKKKDEFFDEEEMKQFSVKDEEEDADDDSGEGGEGEQALNDEEI